MRCTTTDHPVMYMRAMSAPSRMRPRRMPFPTQTTDWTHQCQPIQFKNLWLIFCRWHGSGHMRRFYQGKDWVDREYMRL